MNERRDLPMMGAGGANRLNPRDAPEAPTDQLTPTPGRGLRDPRYHDICQFYGDYTAGANWQPRPGDWVWLPQANEVRLVVDLEPAATGEGAEGIRPRVQVLLLRPADAIWLSGEDCVWLPTLDQLRDLLSESFGSTGFFTSVFTGVTYWYIGELAGMQVENMTALSEGHSPEEAAVKALLMRLQR